MILLAGMLTGCEDAPSPDSYDRDLAVTDIYVEGTSLTLELGASQTITYWPLPANADITKLEWVSQNPAIATVDRWGTVNAASGGTTTLTVSAGTVSKSVSVTVNVPPPPPSSPPPPVQASWLFDDPEDLTKAAVGNGKLELFGDVKATSSAVRIAVGGANYLKVAHGIPFTGGKNYLDEYSILVVFRMPDLNGWRTILQTELDVTARNDGDFFVRDDGGNIGVGSLTYLGPGLVPNKWYRLIISRKGTERMNSYVNGIQYHDTQTDNTRFNLLEAFLLSQDDDNEDGVIEIGQVSVYSEWMSVEQAYGEYLSASE
jgi:hypothetical protein